MGTSHVDRDAAGLPATALALRLELGEPGGAAAHESVSGIEARNVILSVCSTVGYKSCIAIEPYPVFVGPLDVL